MITDKAFLTTHEIAQYLRVTPLTLKNWRRDGEGPPWIRLGPKMIRYPVLGLTDYLMELEDA